MMRNLICRNIIELLGVFGSLIKEAELRFNRLRKNRKVAKLRVFFLGEGNIWLARIFISRYNQSGKKCI